MHCTELDEESHDLLQAITLAGTSKRGTYAKTTPSKLAESLGMFGREVRELLQGLEELGFLEVDTGTSSIKPRQKCSCGQSGTLVDKVESHVIVPASARTQAPGSSRSGVVRTPVGGSNHSPPPLPNPGIAGTPVAPGKVRGERRVKVVRRRENAHSLATALQFSLRRMKRNHGLRWVQAVHHEAVRRQVQNWIDEGIEPETIRKMIEEFTSSPGWLKEGTPPWRTFLARRQDLLDRVDRDPEIVARNAEVGDEDSHWLGSPLADSRTVEDWVGPVEEDTRTEADWLGY